MELSVLVYQRRHERIPLATVLHDDVLNDASSSVGVVAKFLKLWQTERVVRIQKSRNTRKHLQPDTTHRETLVPSGVNF